MADPNAALTAEETPAGDPLRASSPASAVCYMRPHSTHHHDRPSGEQEQQQQQQHEHGPPPALSAPHVDENDCTPRSEAPALPDALAASLLSHMHPLDPEPSYFSPQPLRLYSSAIPHSTPASTDPSPSSSNNASAASLHTSELSTVEEAATSGGLTVHPDRPVFLRDISSVSTASNSTVRANTIDSLHAYTSASSSRQRDGPVYPNQSYAALQFQNHTSPHAPSITRSRSSHPAHSAANSLSSLGAFGISQDHYRDIMDTGTRTVGNSPVSSPGLFDPTKRRSTNFEQLDDGLYSTPWLHPAHRQAPKETHVADVQADPVSGRKIVNQYEIIDELGRGVHGKVKLGKDLPHGRYVAIKIVDRYSKRRRLGKNTSHEDKIKKEIAILKKARHPNIVSLLEVIDDPAKKKVYIVLEHVELGEVKWRTEGAPEVCLVEWRRFKRESQGIFDNENALMEDEKIIRIAHKKLQREQRRAAKEQYLRRKDASSIPAWSLEFGIESDDDYSETGRSSQASNHGDDHHHHRVQFGELHDPSSHREEHMETAFRSTLPPTKSRTQQTGTATGLEGTMYGAYDNDLVRGRTPSIAGSTTSRLTDQEEEVPEHFRYVPLMTFHAAWEAFKDTVLGIEYLHYQNVIHRDIKPANLLVTKEHRIKISDFGVSYLGRQKTDENAGEQSESDFQEVDDAIELAKTVGTPAFYAPELCRTEVDVDTPLIDGSIDIWALGVTLYCLIYGRVPFHDMNSFKLMRIISEEEPYIQPFRLKPVQERSGSRPSSHGRNAQMMSSKRSAHDLEYEAVDENLRDLLRRLLTKDARKRITIPEIKRHPWVLSGIPNSDSWVEETDPSRSFSGRKIEISDADVEKAVIPIGIVERLRSGAKKTFDYVAKGFSRSSGSTRRRAQSSATNPEAPPSMSATSSSSTISQDGKFHEGRRGSLAPIAILEMLGRSRETTDHPLSHSVTASPEARERSRYFDSPDSRTGSPAQILAQRPHLHDRSFSSIHSVQQADALQGRSASPHLPPALPGTPTALDTPSGSQLGGLFGGIPRRVVNSMRSRDKLKLPTKDHSRGKSIDRLIGCDDDPHAFPSLAISTTNVSGHVDQPDALKDLSPVARTSSPGLSESHSFDRLDNTSRQSSTTSMSSRLRRSFAVNNGLESEPTLTLPYHHKLEHSALRAAPLQATQEYDTGRRPSSTAPSMQETSNERFDRAKDELIKRQAFDAKMAREATQSRPSSSYSQAPCPPSPDDVLFQRRKVEDYLNHHDHSSDNSPVGDQERGLAFSSSEEQFTSISQSTSNPSIPSVASAGSSAPDDCAPLDYQFSVMPSESADALNVNRFTEHEDPAGYDGDHAVESDEDDESDDDGGLFIGKKKPLAPNRSNSISNAELARSNVQQTPLHIRRRSARSGSNGTVKKIPPPGETVAEHTNAPTSP